MNIRTVTPLDRESWFHLWRGYLDFYETALDARISEATWRRLLDQNEPIYGMVAIDKADRVIGLVNYVLHANTWTEKPVCYLEDLFVDASARGQGAGRALIGAVVDMAKMQGWHRVYWQTKAGNATARALYDKITPATDWVRYDVDVKT